jgi:hypothetical protein
MSKIRDFEDVLDESLERLFINNESLDQVLGSFPEYADRLKPLLETAMGARQLSAIQPRQEFRENARRQFQAALLEKATGKSRFSFGGIWQHALATAVAVLLVIVTAGSGTVYAASGSMPDSLLYGVKLASEKVQLALTFSTLGKAELNARLADKRVEEIEYLAGSEQPEKIVLIARNMNEHLLEISNLVSPPADMAMSVLSTPAPTTTVPAVTQQPPQAAPPPAPAISPEMPTVNDTAEPAMAPSGSPEEMPLPPVMTAMEPSANETAAGGAEDIARTDVKNAAESVSSGEELDRRGRLKAEIEAQAAINIARIRSLLETSSPSTRAVLEQALMELETEYRRAIEALDR